MFSSGWLNCFPAKLFIPLKKYTSRDYELLGLGSYHMCRKGTSSLGWMQPRWWQQIWVWHWAYALPISICWDCSPFPALVNPSLPSSPCISRGVVHMGPQYSHQAQRFATGKVGGYEVICEDTPFPTLQALHFPWQQSLSPNLIVEKVLLNSRVVLPELFYSNCSYVPKALH